MQPHESRSSPPKEPGSSAPETPSSAKAAGRSSSSSPATPVIYFPPDDIGMAFLEGTETTTASRTLGSARFFSIVTGAGIIEDAAWSYATPLHGAERIAGLIAFDSRLVAVEEV